jgi:proline iminopeptidase
MMGTAPPGSAAPADRGITPPSVYPIVEGFADANGILIHYKSLGRGAPLVVLHGGPGASHDYFLPYFLPLARHNRLIFIDERGSGRSEELENASGYTVENTVEDVEAVRRALGLGKINLLGHSYGGVLAQAYALEFQKNLAHLVLCSTFHSTRGMNERPRATRPGTSTARWGGRGASSSPSSKLVVLPKSGHPTFADQPALFIRAVDDFLNPGAK